jgi:pyruvate formate lyase activating enzyme
MDGAVLNIQRFSIHDGPGIRTTVFLKGCTLRCFWCHNPESIRIQPDLQFHPERCIGCGRCVDACQNGAHRFLDGQHVFLRERCESCGRCAEECFAQALTLAGARMTVEQVMAEVRRDAPFYQTSGGGVTLSGGEPARQPQFAHAVLAACRAEGFHTVVETAAYCAWDDLALLLSETNLVLLDLKHLDTARHRDATGAGNERILDNARRLGALGVPVVARVPVVPGVNDTPDDIAAIATFACSVPGIRELVLLPFHRLGEGKYQSLGLDYRARELQAPAREHMAALASAARACGIDVRVG